MLLHSDAPLLDPAFRLDCLILADPTFFAAAERICSGAAEMSGYSRTTLWVRNVPSTYFWPFIPKVMIGAAAFHVEYADYDPQTQDVRVDFMAPYSALMTGITGYVQLHPALDVWLTFDIWPISDSSRFLTSETESPDTYWKWGTKTSYSKDNQFSPTNTASDSAQIRPKRADSGKVHSGCYEASEPAFSDDVWWSCQIQLCASKMSTAAVQDQNNVEDFPDSASQYLRMPTLSAITGPYSAGMFNEPTWIDGAALVGDRRSAGTILYIALRQLPPSVMYEVVSDPLFAASLFSVRLGLYRIPSNQVLLSEARENRLLLSFALPASVSVSSPVRICVRVSSAGLALPTFLFTSTMQSSFTVISDGNTKDAGATVPSQPVPLHSSSTGALNHDSQPSQASLAAAGPFLTLRIEPAEVFGGITVVRVILQSCPARRRTQVLLTASAAGTVGEWTPVPLLQFSSSAFLSSASASSADTMMGTSPGPPQCEIEFLAPPFPAVAAAVASSYLLPANCSNRDFVLQVVTEGCDVAEARFSLSYVQSSLQCASAAVEPAVLYRESTAAVHISLRFGAATNVGSAPNVAVDIAGRRVPDAVPAWAPCSMLFITAIIDRDHLDSVPDGVTIAVNVTVANAVTLTVGYIRIVSEPSVLLVYPPFVPLELGCIMFLNAIGFPVGLLSTGFSVVARNINESIVQPLNVTAAVAVECDRESTCEGYLISIAVPAAPNATEGTSFAAEICACKRGSGSEDDCDQICANFNFTYSARPMVLDVEPTTLTASTYAPLRVDVDQFDSIVDDGLILLVTFNGVPGSVLAAARFPGGTSVSLKFEAPPMPSGTADVFVYRTGGYPEGNPAAALNAVMFVQIFAIKATIVPSPVGRICLTGPLPCAPGGVVVRWNSNAPTIWTQMNAMGDENRTMCLPTAAAKGVASLTIICPGSTANTTATAVLGSPISAPETGTVFVSSHESLFTRRQDVADMTQVVASTVPILSCEVGDVLLPEGYWLGCKEISVRCLLSSVTPIALPPNVSVRDFNIVAFPKCHSAGDSPRLKRQQLSVEGIQLFEGGSKSNKSNMVFNLSLSSCQSQGFDCTPFKISFLIALGPWASTSECSVHKPPAVVRAEWQACGGGLLLSLDQDASVSSDGDISCSNLFETVSLPRLGGGATCLWVSARQLRVRIGAEDQAATFAGGRLAFGDLLHIRAGAFVSASEQSLSSLPTIIVPSRPASVSFTLEVIAPKILDATAPLMLRARGSRCPAVSVSWGSISDHALDLWLAAPPAKNGSYNIDMVEMGPGTLPLSQTGVQYTLTAAGTDFFDGVSIASITILKLAGGGPSLSVSISGPPAGFIGQGSLQLVGLVDSLDPARVSLSTPIAFVWYLVSPEQPTSPADVAFAAAVAAVQGPILVFPLGSLPTGEYVIGVTVVAAGSAELAPTAEAKMVLDLPMSVTAHIDGGALRTVEAGAPLILSASSSWIRGMTCLSNGSMEMRFLWSCTWRRRPCRTGGINGGGKLVHIQPQQIVVMPAGVLQPMTEPYTFVVYVSTVFSGSDEKNVPPQAVAWQDVLVVKGCSSFEVPAEIIVVRPKRLVSAKEGGRLLLQPEAGCARFAAASANRETACGVQRNSSVSNLTWMVQPSWVGTTDVPGSPLPNMSVLPRLSVDLAPSLTLDCSALRSGVTYVLSLVNDDGISFSKLFIEVRLPPSGGLCFDSLGLPAAPSTAAASAAAAGAQVARLWCKDWLPEDSDAFPLSYSFLLSTSNATSMDGHEAGPTNARAGVVVFQAIYNSDFEYILAPNTYLLSVIIADSLGVAATAPPHLVTVPSQETGGWIAPVNRGAALLKVMVVRDMVGDLTATTQVRIAQSLVLTSRSTPVT